MAMARHTTRNQLMQRRQDHPIFDHFPRLGIQRIEIVYIEIKNCTTKSSTRLRKVTGEQRGRVENPKFMILFGCRGRP